MGRSVFRVRIPTIFVFYSVALGPGLDSTVAAFRLGFCAAIARNATLALISASKTTELEPGRGGC
jgi:hypothetical protein